MSYYWIGWSISFSGLEWTPESDILIAELVSFLAMVFDHARNEAGLDCILSSRTLCQSVQLGGLDQKKRKVRHLLTRTFS
jgi:hypothetical protein